MKTWIKRLYGIKEKKPKPIGIYHKGKYFVNCELPIVSYEEFMRARGVSQDELKWIENIEPEYTVKGKNEI